METPLSSTRITRSQASKSESEKSNKGCLKSRHPETEKTALIDITNGSPIVGLAMGCLKTPSSRCVKKSMTPGSGETLLRGQVKTLLQKVEEEAVISKICFEPLIRKRFVHSPMAVLAPTPANTPQLYSFSTGESFTVSPVTENSNFTQMLNEVIAESSEEDRGEKEKKVVTKSLFMDFSEISNDSDASDCSSVQTCQDSDSSAWSVQVNAATSEEYKDDEYYKGVVVDELCEGMSDMSVSKGEKLSKFVCESEGETEEEREEKEEEKRGV